MTAEQVAELIMNYDSNNEKIGGSLTTESEDFEPDLESESDFDADINMHVCLCLHVRFSVEVSRPSNIM